MPSCWVDDMALEDYGLNVLRGSRGWVDGLGISFQSQAIPGAFNQVLNPESLAAEVRSLDLKVQVVPASMAVRKAVLSAIYGLQRGLHEVRFADDPTRFIEAKLVAAVSEADLILPQVYGSLRFIAQDPRFFSTRIESVHLPAGTKVPIPIGEAGVRADLYISGIATSTVLTIRSGRTGETLGTMTLTGLLSTSQWLRLTLDRRELYLGVGSPAAETDAYSWKGSTDMWTALDAGDVPNITLSAGDGILLARRAYPA